MGQVVVISPEEASYPKDRFATWSPNLPALHTLGNLDLLRLPLTALFCSRECPGDATLKAYDQARGLHEKETSVIGGFHTLLKKDMLEIILKGKGPIVICSARALEGMRIAEKIQKALNADRLLICTISPASVKHKLKEHRQIGIVWLPASQMKKCLFTFILGASYSICNKQSAKSSAHDKV